MKMVNTIFLRYSCISALFTNVFGITDYCSVNTFISNENYMQFTKEPSAAEYAVTEKFKGLHCCAKGYRSIEWLKDGRPYPWPATTSHLILYPESANQTIYTTEVKIDDSGNYTCLLRNDSVVHMHVIELKVFDKAPDDPKITYISDDTEVAVGQPTRLFCEAFVGRVDLPDAYNEAVWRKAGQNGTINDTRRIRQEKLSREAGQTFGTYLIIESVIPEDYGEYVCTISKPGKTKDLKVFITEKIDVVYLNRNPVQWVKIIMVLVIVGFLAVIAILVYCKYGLSMRVHFKDRFGPLEDNEGKVNDVQIIYSERDSEIVLGVLLPTLESRYSYKCGTCELPVNIDSWYSYLLKSAKKSRRIIPILSPGALNGKWDNATIQHALKQLQSFGSQLCCIALKEIVVEENQTKDLQGETLASLLRKRNVIFWERSNDSQFWLALRLRLPPKRQTANIAVTSNGITANSKRLTSDSQECSGVSV